MDIVVKGRRTEVPERFRRHATGKLEKLEKLDGKVIRLDVEVSKERNPRLSDRCDRVEITLRSRGPVIRAEASAADPYAAFDAAAARLESRLRKNVDRRRVHHGHRTPVSVAAATAPLAAAGRNGPPAGAGASDKPRKEGPLDVDGEGPLVVREKTHRGQPMNLAQALYEMELVGHDFYLFVDSDTDTPSVVYRRRGYDYGVIHLEV